MKKVLKTTGETVQVLPIVHKESPLNPSAGYSDVVFPPEKKGAKSRIQRVSNKKLKKPPVGV